MVRSLTMEETAPEVTEVKNVCQLEFALSVPL